MLLLCVVLGIGLGLGITVANRTQDLQTDNIVTMGNIQAAVLSETLDAEGQPIPFNGQIVTVVPGHRTPWTLAVANKGNQPAYIRILLDKTITPAEGLNAALDSDKLCFAFPETDWVYQDGYYYYTKVLEPTEQTSPLFTDVWLSEDADDLYQGCSASAKIYVQTVQTANNGDSALEAAGWPEMESSAE